MDATLGRRSLVDRMRGAALFDVATYEEVEHDTSATGQAAVVVALAAVASGIGNAFRGGPGILAGVVAMLLGWVVWSGVTYLVGTRLFGGMATWGELLRTLGFAQAPGVLLVAAIVPGLGWLVILAVFLWTLGTGFVAIRQALDVDSGKALMTAVVAWVANALATWILGMVFGSTLF
ncbi:YIP1 family protein [Roseisolibacter sp. H3M3-2]|uniref:YIP1 family protein n=1 Tax=Roseisolibacter sp. H3M3-2 TaxID=3031323 RepID=UPI0023DA7CA2|nr:YIP1 family protein [Roseisolibacter sp. H3M3-2]MDF1505056.1 YIP1 family protein [Roseisolibacter sp. H3M3-2]